VDSAVGGSRIILWRHSEKKLAREKPANNRKIISGVTCSWILSKKEKAAEKICSRRHIELRGICLKHKKEQTSELGTVFC
jgi:hypothetical protein